MKFLSVVTYGVLLQHTKLFSDKYRHIVGNGMLNIMSFALHPGSERTLNLTYDLCCITVYLHVLVDLMYKSNSILS